MQDKKDGKWETLNGLIFTLTAVVVLVVLLVLYKYDADRQYNWNETTGLITRVDSTTSRRNGKTSKSYEVWVEYEVDGEILENPLDSYSSSMRRGQELELIVNPANANKVAVKRNPVVILIMAVPASSIFGLIGLTLLIRGFILKRRARLED